MKPIKTAFAVTAVLMLLGIGFSVLAHARVPGNATIASGPLAPDPVESYETVVHAGLLAMHEPAIWLAALPSVAKVVSEVHAARRRRQRAGTRRRHCSWCVVVILVGMLLGLAGVIAILANVLLGGPGSVVVPATAGGGVLYGVGLVLMLVGHSLGCVAELRREYRKFRRLRGASS